MAEDFDPEISINVEEIASRSGSDLVEDDLGSDVECVEAESTFPVGSANDGRDPNDLDPDVSDRYVDDLESDLECEDEDFDPDVSNLDEVDDLGTDEEDFTSFESFVCSWDLDDFDPVSFPEPEFSDLEPDFSDLEPDFSDLGPDFSFSDLGPDFSDLEPNSSDLGPDFSDPNPNCSDLGLDPISASIFVARADFDFFESDLSPPTSGDFPLLSKPQRTPSFIIGCMTKGFPSTAWS